MMQSVANPKALLRGLRVFAVMSACVCAHRAKADVHMPAIFSDNMVMQAGVDAPIWGWADPNEEVTVAASWGATATTRADDHGKWQVVIAVPALPEDVAADTGLHKPESLTISGTNTITIANVLVGQVWLASGQSNMEMPVADHGGGYRGVTNWREEIASANHPDIRFFTVENTIADAPADDCRGRWVVCSPQIVGDFSAVAYFFARQINARTNQPVGIIDADWSGTPAQAWTSAEGLADFSAYKPGLDLIRRMREEPEALEAEYQKAYQAWQKRMASNENIAWTTLAFDTSDWQTIAVPGNWSEPPLNSYDGAVWMRTTVDIPDDWAGKALTLSLGPIDDNDVTFFNGVLVGQTQGWNLNRTYTVPGDLVKAGKAVIAVNVIDTGGLGGIHGQPDQMFLSPAGHATGTPLSLSGQWHWKLGKETTRLDPPRRKTLSPYMPSTLFNGMISPIIPYAIKGAIWYQGESNRDRAIEYRDLFPAMIADWRNRWNQGDFPFYFVQIAPYHYNGDTGQTALLREAQLGTMLHVPNTGMAVTMDIGNPRNIHPSNKQEVGRRLALWALAKDYGMDDLEYSGPLPKSATVQGRTMRIEFSHAAGLYATGAARRGFELADENHIWHAAQARIEGNAVVLSAYGVLTPTAARYGWDDENEPNLFNSDNLPATPFRTDDWLGLDNP